MTLVNLSSANLNYINNLSKTKANPTQLQPSLKQDEYIKKDVKSKKKISKILAFSAVILTAALCAYNYINKRKANLDDVKKILTPLEDISFKGGVAYAKNSEDVFSGTILKTMKNGDNFEITYNNGKLAQSIKTNQNGDFISKKIYNYKTSDLADKTINTTTIRIYDNSSISNHYETKLITPKDGSKAYRQSSQTKLDSQNKTAHQVLAFVHGNKGDILLDNRNPDKSRVIRFNLDGEKIEKFTPLNYILQEKPTADGFEHFKLDLKNHS